MDEEIDLNDPSALQKTYLEFLQKIPKEASAWLMRHTPKPKTVEEAAEILQEDYFPAPRIIQDALGGTHVVVQQEQLDLQCQPLQQLF